MALSCLNNLPQTPPKWWSHTPSASLERGSKVMNDANNLVTCFQEPGDRIRKMLSEVKLSVSAYDTAWVTMIPSPIFLQRPCFPDCLNWILNNQLPDGSWGLPDHHPLLIKDSLSSSLACVLALKRWNVGEGCINRGLHFIQSKFSLVNDEKQHSPIGFDIIFPGMVEYAGHLGLNIPLSPADVNSILCKRDAELRRCSGSNSKGRKAYLAYVAEGLGELQDWDEVMRYQRNNGSLFNSPSTTAAAFIHLQDFHCLNYLHSLLEMFGNGVPTAYPLDIYSRLCVLDSLVSLGIDRHFRKEIRHVLDETYRCWMQRDEEIFLDTATCAMAFRMLRINGYDISSDALVQFDEGHFFNSLEGHIKDIGTALELYRASEIIISSNELALEKLNLWSSCFLAQELSKISIHSEKFHKYINQEVDFTLKFPSYATLERLANRRNVEHYDLDSIRVRKASYRVLNVDNWDFLKLAVDDFNYCQSIYREELKHLERWVVENRLDKLNFARQKLTYAYFSAAATLCSPELSDARMSWAKNGVLTTVVDDFFDIGGSKEELVNLTELVEKWDGNLATDCCSEQVEIIFSALHSTMSEIGLDAFEWQGRSVMSHLIHIWLDLMKSMMRETEWSSSNYVPTMDEYVTNGYVSFALGPIVLTTLYLAGPVLAEEVVNGWEYYNLFKLMSTCGRLINDVQTFERESKEGKLNAVSLHMIHGGSDEEEAVRKMRGVIESNRRELLRLVLHNKDGGVPRACKDLFWKMCQVFHLFYSRNDGFTSPHEMVSYVNAVIHEPLNILSIS